MNIYLDINQLQDSNGTNVEYEPVIHWTLDEHDRYMDWETMQSMCQSAERFLRDELTKSMRIGARRTTRIVRRT